MARSKELLLNRMLRRGEDAGLLVSAAALPALPSRAHPAGFLDLPPWYERPRVEVTLLLTVLGGMIAWAAWGVLAFMRSRAEGTLVPSHRAIVYKRLRTAAFYAVVAGADLLVIQFLRT